VADRADAGKDGDFDSDSVYLLRSMNVPPRTAARLRQPGLTDAALVSLIEDALFRHGISRDDLPEALPWLAARFDPEAAQVWRANGFGLGEAQAWRDEHFGVKQAVQWRRLGDTPARARDVAERFRTAGVTITDGLRMLDEGLTVDEICAPPNRAKAART
jgi:hypothetical protein